MNIAKKYGPKKQPTDKVWIFANGFYERIYVKASKYIYKFAFLPAEQPSHWILLCVIGCLDFVNERS